MRRFIKEAAVVGLLLTAAGQAAEPNCLPWASAAPVIAKNSLLPANIIYQMVQSRTGGQIIHASLCDQDAGFSTNSSCSEPRATSSTSPLTL